MYRGVPVSIMFIKINILLSHNNISNKIEISDVL